MCRCFGWRRSSSPPRALLSSSPSAPPSSPLVLILVNIIDKVAISGVANRFNIVSRVPPETKMTAKICNVDAGCDYATAERRPQAPSRHHGGQDQGCLIPGGNPRGQLSSHSPLVRWLVVASMPLPLVLSNPPARHPSRCHPSRCHLCRRPPSQRCGHRRRY